MPIVTNEQYFKNFFGDVICFKYGNTTFHVRTPKKPRITGLHYDTEIVDDDGTRHVTYINWTANERGSYNFISSDNEWMCLRGERPDLLTNLLESIAEYCMKRGYVEHQGEPEQIRFLDKDVWEFRLDESPSDGVEPSKQAAG